MFKRKCADCSLFGHRCVLYFVFCVFILLMPLRAAAETETVSGGTAASEANPAESTQDEGAAGFSLTDPSADPGTLYIENEWGFVEESMDVSHGIPEGAQGRLERIKSIGKLTVATEPYYAPQEFIDPTREGQEQYVGADMELARLIAERMGVELEIVPLDFSEVLAGTAEGKYDLAISGLAYTPERASSMELSKGYHFSDEGSGTGVLIRLNEFWKFRSVDDFKEKNIAAQSGSLQEMLMVEHVPRYHQFRRYNSIQEVYDAVQNGDVDAGAVDIETAKLYVAANPGCGLALTDSIVFGMEDQFQGDRIAGPPGEIELMYFVNGVIDEVLESGTYKDWFKEYTDYAARLGL